MSVCSMTGFAAASSSQAGLSVAVSMRSVNHRYLDVVLKLPAELRPLEVELRDLLKQRLARGRVETTIELSGVAGAGLELDLPVAEQVGRMAEEIAASGLRLAAPSAIEVLRYPGVVRSSAASSLSEPEQSAVIEAMNAALDLLVSARTKEGDGLASNLRQIVTELGSIVDRIRLLSQQQRGAVVGRYQDRLVQLLEPLAVGGSGAALDEARVVQEAGMLAEKVDVAEETERLALHLDAIGDVLERGGACGKRLDFLAQELLREVNTVASKCRDAAISAVTVDAKVLCERFREQVQNVE